MFTVVFEAPRLDDIQIPQGIPEEDPDDITAQGLAAIEEFGLPSVLRERVKRGDGKAHEFFVRALRRELATIAGIVAHISEDMTRHGGWLVRVRTKTAQRGVQPSREAKPLAFDQEVHHVWCDDSHCETLSDRKRFHAERAKYISHSIKRALIEGLFGVSQ